MSLIISHSVQDLIEKIKTGHYEFPSDPWDTISKQAKNLVKHCLSINPKTRYCPSEALMHPWITNVLKLIINPSHLL